MDVGEQVTYSKVMEHINKVFTVGVLHADCGDKYSCLYKLHDITLFRPLGLACPRTVYHLFSAMVCVL